MFLHHFKKKETEDKKIAELVYQKIIDNINLIISNKMDSFDILFSLTELENRRDYGNKLRDNLNELLKKDDILKEEDKILFYKLYQKLKSEFEEIK